MSVVLFNLGGPDDLTAVRPFLFNLFHDPAITGLPQPFRWLFAQMISRLREKTAVEIYRHMGGGSPLVRETEAQRAALSTLLTDRLGGGVQVVVAMRYWRPLAEEAAAAVRTFAPDQVVLLPLYPQYSTTTSASSLETWTRAYKGPGAIHTVCCYPTEDRFIEAHAAKIRQALNGEALSDYRLIFSAHGLPETIVARGDPYQNQVERTARAVAERLGAKDWKVSYQSRVGPLKWIGPATLEVLSEAGREGLAVLVTPIAFVSEHSETLVELDIDYRKAAFEAGCSGYRRVSALGVDGHFIDGLANMVQAALGRAGVQSMSPPCAEVYGRCPLRTGASAR